MLLVASSACAPQERRLGDPNQLQQAAPEPCADDVRAIPPEQDVSLTFADWLAREGSTAPLSSDSPDGLTIKYAYVHTFPWTLGDPGVQCASSNVAGNTLTFSALLYGDLPGEGTELVQFTELAIPAAALPVAGSMGFVLLGGDNPPSGRWSHYLWLLPDPEVTATTIQVEDLL